MSGNKAKQRISTKDMVLIPLFTALIAVGAFIKIPMPTCPLTLQWFFVMCAGILLGSSSQCFYICPSGTYWYPDLHGRRRILVCLPADFRLLHRIYSLRVSDRSHGRKEGERFRRMCHSDSHPISDRLCLRLCHPEFLFGGRRHAFGKARNVILCSAFAG